jgi:hypothetical protein
MLTVRAVADRLGYAHVEPVLRLITSGALKAANVASSPGRRTWRISEADLSRFISERTYSPTAAVPPAKKRKPKAAATQVPAYV